MSSKLNSDMNNNYKHIIRLMFTAVLMWSSCSIQAEKPADETESSMSPSVRDWFKNGELPGNLQFQGFASQAFISTSDNDVFGNTDENGGSFGFTEVGLNALMRPMPRLQLSAQVLTRRAGNGSSATPRLDFGFADYRLYSHETNQFGFRIGRLKNPFGFYNDTRDVAFTRPSIILPQSIYFDRTRNLVLSSDAVHFYADSSHTDFGSIAIQFGLIRPIVDDKDTKTIIGVNQPGDLTSSLSYIGRGVYETNDKRIRLAVSGSRTNVGYDPALGDKLKAGTIQFSPIIFSAEYNTEKWSLTSEYALRHFRIRNFGAPFPLNDSNFTGESYYFQGVYRFNTKWEGLLRYDVLYTDKSDRSGKAFARKSGGVVPAHSRFAKDITVGLRWNVTPSFMLRAEYHRVNGTAWLSRLDNPGSSATSQHWNLFAVQASFRF